ncbi:ribosomal RNA processing protein 36 homolog [Melanotaenia boesemani]|uniref:ribosomal RNA processing protein 36 homolog n=1 Tax=Melanotaenia boesemani TaxID=1250792 RepID=UPI001C05E6A1|nr:ribosomal RNA processing protein 36 homolog [Melanotaenia boesemani]
MKGRKNQKHELVDSKKKNVASSTDDDDSDVEKNFALLTQRGGESGGSEEWHHGGAEEDEAEEELESEEEEDSDDSLEKEENEGESEIGEEEESDDGEEEEENEISEASDEEDDNEEGGSSKIQTKDDIRKELSNMSFEDIMKLQNKVGTKVYNEVAYGSKKSPETSKKKRLNKNRPMEISAKRPAPFLRQVVPVKKPTLRDPRFDDLSGEYKPEIFEKTYKFINDIKQREKEIIHKRLKKTKKNNQNKEKLQFLLRRLENQERARQHREQQRERELQFKRQQRERAGQGGRPFFLKKSEKRKLQLVEKFQELKKSGKLENFLSKKRKRNAVKDRRKLPRQLQKKEAA